MNQLPASVKAIADVLGRERALYLIGQLPRYYRRDGRWPGAQSSETILYVPKALPPGHRLTRLLGWQDAMKLVRAFGGEILKPACCAEIYRPFRDAGIVAMVAAGEAHEVVAGLMGVSAKHVKNLLREIPREDAQAVVRNMPPMSTAGSKPMTNHRRQRQRGKAR